MRASAPRSVPPASAEPLPKNGAGFTLLELLVVILIVGLVSSLAILSMGPGGREQQLEREALRLTQLLSVAAQEAILQGREIGVAVEEDGYRFLTAGQAQWEEIKGADALRPRTLPSGVSLELMEGYQPETSLFALEEDEDEEEKKTIPQLVFFSTGEIVPFELKLLMEEEAAVYRLEGEANGQLNLVAEVPAQ